VEVEPAVAQQPALHLWCLVGQEVSRMTCTSRSAGTSRLTLFKKAMKLPLVWLVRVVSDNAAGGDLEGGEQSQVPLRW
jgi:hypothetical protein